MNFWSNRHIIGIDKKLLKNDFSIEEVKTGVAHEVGHILKNHFSFTNVLIRGLQKGMAFPNLYFLMGHYLAPYNQRMEFEADKKALELYNETASHLGSLLGKLESKEIDDLSFIMKYCENIVRFLRIDHPEPYEQCYSHPPPKERIKALNAQSSCFFFKQNNQDDTCDLDRDASKANSLVA